jgi:hypothetical protein
MNKWEEHHHLQQKEDWMKATSAEVIYDHNAAGDYFEEYHYGYLH